jgi:hypothetical protein
MSIFERSSLRIRVPQRAWLGVVVLGALLSFSASARAAPDFPTLLAEQLSMPCPPPCTICHQDLAGGFSTVVKPFGRAMMAAGLTPVDDTMAPALATLEKNKTDSDGDGIGDVLELSAGKDPNGSADLCGLTPRYGCGAHIASGATPDPASSLTAFFVASLLATRARRSSKRQRRPSA